MGDVVDSFMCGVRAATVFLGFMAGLGIGLGIFAVIVGLLDRDGDRRRAARRDAARKDGPAPPAPPSRVGMN